MTTAEEKKYIEGYINGLTSGDNSDLYAYGYMEERLDTLVMQLDVVTDSDIDKQIVSLTENINNMLEAENMPYTAYINIEVVLSPEERSEKRK